MLSINVPSNGPSRIRFSTFMNYVLPMPSQGITHDQGDNLVLLFDNEQTAIDYAKRLKQLPGSQKKAGNEIIASILNYFRSKSK